MAEQAEVATRLPQVDQFAADRQEYAQAKSDPDAKSALKELFERIASIAREAKAQIVQAFSLRRREQRPDLGALDDPNSPAHKIEKTAVNVREYLKNLKHDPDLVPQTNEVGERIIQNLVEVIPDIETLEAGAAVYFHEVVRKAINHEIDDPLQAISENELINLMSFNPDMASRLKSALIAVAEETGSATPLQIEEFRKIGETSQAESSNNPENWTDEEYNRDAQRRTMNPEEEAMRPEAEYIFLKRRVPEEFHKLIDALVDPDKNFVNFIRSLEGEFSDLEGEALNKKVSREFADRVANLVGKLYERVDQGNPDDYWEEVEQKGGFFSSTRILNEFIFSQLQTLSDRIFPEDSGLGDYFYIKKELHGDRNIPTKSLAQLDKDGFLKSRRDEEHPNEVYRAQRPTTEPFFKWGKARSFKTYMIEVTHHADDQRRLRQALHNAVALFRKPKPENGFMATLEQYVANFLKAEDLDLIASQPDADLVFAATALLDGFIEVDYAKYDWMHNSKIEQRDPSSRRPIRGLVVEDYLRILNKDLNQDKNEWRVLRAITMAMGDAHAISMRRLEHGARGIPPRNPKKGYAPDYASYDLQDAGLYMSLYPQGHYNLRYSMEETLMGNLLFLKVEGKDLRDYYKRWDHRKMVNEMRTAMNSFMEGKTPQDEANETMRLVNWINPGGVGGIYTRGWWRYWAGYEAYLPTHETHANILECWQSIENIGVEVLKDFVDWRIDELNPEFFESAGKDQRRELVSYLSRRYFKRSDHIMTDAEIEAKFRQIESEGSHSKHKLEKKYKEFFYQTLTRALYQRKPTKFLRYEATRDVVGRERAWSIVKRSSGMEPAVEDENDDRFDTAVRDIILAEVKLRTEISKELFDRYDPEKRGDQKLYNIDVSDIGQKYELTQETLSGYLEEMFPGVENRLRRENALKVYEKTVEFIEGQQEYVEEGKTEGYLDHFAGKYEKGLPFALATDELERRLIAHRTMGNRGPTRAIGDMAQAEAKVGELFVQYFDLLKEVANDGNHNFHPLVKALEKVKKQVEIDVGPEKAFKLVHHFAAVTIQFYLRDEISRWTVVKAMGGTMLRVNSIAGEFASSGDVLSKVWEWEPDVADKFIDALTDMSLLKTKAKEFIKPADYETESHDIKIPFTNKKIHLWDSKVLIPEHDWTSTNLRNNFNLTKRDVIFDQIVKKFGIILALYILGKLAFDGFKEFWGDEKGGGGRH